MKTSIKQQPDTTIQLTTSSPSDILLNIKLTDQIRLLIVKFAVY